MTLTDHLHACMREANRVPGAAGAHAAFREAVQWDAALATEAETHLAGLVDAVTDKCFISRTHRAALQEALKP